jgi:hypothetical protein
MSVDHRTRPVVSAPRWTVPASPSAGARHGIGSASAQSSLTTGVLRELHRSETSFARDLLALSDRHCADPEIHQFGRDIARWSQIHVRRIAEVSRHYGIKRQPQPRWDHGPLSRLAQRAGSALHRRLEASLLLLADLLRVHRKAAGVSLDWEPLAQAAQAMKERVTRADPVLPSTDAAPDALGERHLQVSSAQIIAS